LMNARTVSFSIFHAAENISTHEAETLRYPLAQQPAGGLVPGDAAAANRNNNSCKRCKSWHSLPEDPHKALRILDAARQIVIDGMDDGGGEVVSLVTTS
jgi:hypothetical protein